MLNFARSAEHLQQVLGYVFQDPDLLRQALTHRSFAVRHNERLEFIGDGILNALTARALYQAFPDLPEGDLSRIRARIVCQDGLAQVAAVFSLGHHLFLGEGELKSGGFNRPSILADALESLLGAIWLDGGYVAVEQVVDRLFAPVIAAIDPQSAGKDPKTALQEWLQGRKLALPEYVLLHHSGDSPEQTFTVSCEVGALQMQVQASAASKRLAEREAAAELLDKLRKTYPGKKLILRNA